MGCGGSLATWPETKPGKEVGKWTYDEAVAAICAPEDQGGPKAGFFKAPQQIGDVAAADFHNMRGFFMGLTLLTENDGDFKCDLDFKYWKLAADALEKHWPQGTVKLDVKTVIHYCLGVIDSEKLTKEQFVAYLWMHHNLTPIFNKQGKWESPAVFTKEMKAEAIKMKTELPNLKTLTDNVSTAAQDAVALTYGAASKMTGAAGDVAGLVGGLIGGKADEAGKDVAAAAKEKEKELDAKKKALKEKCEKLKIVGPVNNIAKFDDADLANLYVLLAKGVLALSEKLIVDLKDTAKSAVDKVKN